MKVYLPWLGEFGNELLRWVPAVRNCQEPRIACYEEGKDCLYPCADGRHIVPRVNEQDRVCSGALTQKSVWDEVKKTLGPDHEYITPSTLMPLYPEYQHFEPLTKDFGFSCDIAVFPRWRHNTKRLNWENWPKFVSLLQATGYRVFACGHPDSSFNVDCPAAWDYDNPLEASIWAIKHSKIRIGMITALTVMSLYCGKEPWVLVNQRGMKCNTGRDAPNFAYLWFADWQGVGWRVYPYLNQYIEMMPIIEKRLS